MAPERRTHRRPGGVLWTPRRRSIVRRLSRGHVALRSAALLALGTGLLAHAGDAAAGAGSSSTSAGRAIVFGIYPGGAAGAVGPPGAVAPEDPAKELAALRRLRPPGRAFVLHLYVSYTGPGSRSAADQVAGRVERYADAGFQTEVVLAYRPADRDPSVDVPGFAAFAREAVRDLGPQPCLVALQVTNEANVPNAPDAADGWYPGARDALLAGVVAAKSEARSRGLDVRIGFNWAFALDPSQARFWKGIGDRGGRAFRTAVDWVGLDVYPATWGPGVRGGDLAARTSNTMLEALAALRDRYMPLAGLAAALPIHVSENGYPTGPGRTAAMQADVLRAAVATVVDHRATFNITDYRWFDLRDADSSGSGFESGYGLLRDDYLPKPAFAAFRDAVAGDVRSVATKSRSQR